MFTHNKIPDGDLLALKAEAILQDIEEEKLNRTRGEATVNQIGGVYAALFVVASPFIIR